MCFVGFCMGIWSAQVTVGGFKGKGFAGQLTSRVWYLKVHSASEPFAVVLTNSSGQAVELPKYVFPLACYHARLIFTRIFDARLTDDLQLQPRRREWRQRRTSRGAS